MISGNGCWVQKFQVASLLAVACFVFSSCSRAKTADAFLYYDTLPFVKPLIPLIAEISGIADSKANPGFLWGQEDSGNPPRLYLIGHDGIVSKTIFIKGAVNRDWEDMALSDGKIYIGDIGDNNAVYQEYLLYVFDEPSSLTDTVDRFETIRFMYADGPRDAEAFIVDAATRDIYIISKRDNPSRVYKIAYPYAAGINTAVQAGHLSYSGAVSATIAPSAHEILIKTYTSIYRYTRSQGASIAQALSGPPTMVAGYKTEPLGEAISFRHDGSGFFTLSEKGFAAVVNLCFYKKR